MGLVEGILRVTHVATGAEGVAVGLHVRLLAVYFVAGNAGNAGLTVVAGAPLGDRTLVAGAAQLIRRGDLHALAGMVVTIRAVARLAGHAGSDELASLRVVPGGVTGKALALVFDPLEIGLEDRIERGLRVGRPRPGVKFGGVTLGAVLRTLEGSPRRRRHPTSHRQPQLLPAAKEP